MTQDEKTRSLNFLKELHKRVIRQNKLVEIVLDATLRNRNLLSSDKKTNKKFLSTKLSM